MDNMVPSLGFDAGRSSINRPRPSSDSSHLNSLSGRLTTSQSFSGDLFEQILSIPVQPTRDPADSLVEEPVSQSVATYDPQSDSDRINSESKEEADPDSELESETQPVLLSAALATQPIVSSHEELGSSGTFNRAENQPAINADAEKQSNEDGLLGEAESTTPAVAEEIVESQNVVQESADDNLDSNAPPKEDLAIAEDSNAQLGLNTVEQEREVVADEAVLEEPQIYDGEQEIDELESESSRSSHQDDVQFEPTSNGSIVEEQEPDRESHTQRSERREKWYEARSVGVAESTNEQDPTQQDASQFSQDEQLTQALQAETAQLQTNPDDLAVDGGNATPTAVGPTETTGLPSTGASSTSLAGVHLEFGSETTAVNEQSSIASSGSDSSRASLRTGRSSVSPTNGNSEQAADLTQAERVRLVQRVARSFARLGPSGGSISIKLHPPQLGALNVQVRLEGRSMTAKLTTETAAARDVILESLPVLRGRLAEQGFEISQFQVEVADNQTDAASSGNQQQLGQSGSDSGEGGNRSVDQRRVSLRQRQQLEGANATATHMRPRELIWQTMAGIDLQA